MRSSVTRWQRWGCDGTLRQPEGAARQVPAVACRWAWRARAAAAAWSPTVASGRRAAVSLLLLRSRSAGVGPAEQELVVAQDRHEQIAVGGDPVDPGLAEGGGQAAGSLVAAGAQATTLASIGS